MAGGEAVTSEFRLEIGTPDRVFFSGKVDSLIVNTLEGQQGFLIDHSPVVVAVTCGIISFRSKNEDKQAVTGNGFLEMAGKKAILLCDFAEWPNEVDVTKTRDERDRLQEELNRQSSRKDYAVTKAALERAIQRLKLASVSTIYREE